MTPSPAAARHRLDAIDLARGVAVAAMVAYHFSWDLGALGFIETDIVQNPGWRWFARLVAGSFLVLAGIGLVLAHGRAVRARPFLRRLATIGAAALAISIATSFAFPQSYIFFGILHCIAVGSVLALPFLRAPGAVIAVAAALTFAAPWVLTDPGLDRPALQFLGLGAQAPVTNDYVPIFPWFALILAGLLLGRLLEAHPGSPISAWAARGPAARFLVLIGRHSLAIYLVHQVVLYGALSGIRQLVGPNAVVSCVRHCAAQSGADRDGCRASCVCVVGMLTQRGALDRVLAGRPSAADQAVIEEAAGFCRRRPGQS